MSCPRHKQEALSRIKDLRRERDKRIKYLADSGMDKNSDRELERIERELDDASFDAM